MRPNAQEFSLGCRLAGLACELANRWAGAPITSKRPRRNTVAAATCSGSLMVWCLAQTRSWLATTALRVPRKTARAESL